MPMGTLSVPSAAVGLWGVFEVVSLAAGVCEVLGADGWWAALLRAPGDLRELQSGGRV